MKKQQKYLKINDSVDQLKFELSRIGLFFANQAVGWRILHILNTCDIEELSHLKNIDNTDMNISIKLDSEKSSLKMFVFVKKNQHKELIHVFEYTIYKESLKYLNCDNNGSWFLSL